MRLAAASGAFGILLAAQALQENHPDARAGAASQSMLFAPWGRGSIAEGASGGDASTNAAGSVQTEQARARRGKRAKLTAGSSSLEGVKDRIFQIIFGVIFLAIAMPVHWFNEERSARLNTLLARGQGECVELDSSVPNESNRGLLVHVQGKTRGAVPVADGQFLDAEVENCLKLQSTVEVFEWVQQPRKLKEGAARTSQPRFRAEWTTVHHDTARFTKPSPENPRLPAGLVLGTVTKACKRVELGGFVLTEGMVRSFHKFEPAMPRLPDNLTAHGLVFLANRSDGYYYSRPSLRGAEPGRHLIEMHQVGDVRARFTCVPEGDATVVGVQCARDGDVSFVPYRPIPRAFWPRGARERQMLIEAGDRPLRDLKRESSCCCAGGVASFCCCACNSIAYCCKEEVITEEILHVSDRLEPKEKVFERVVQRNPCRVWNFRVLGSVLMFWGASMILGPFASVVSGVPSLRMYGPAAPAVVSIAVACSMHSFVVALAYSRYRPLVALLWLVLTGVVLAAPFELSLAA